MLTMLLLAIGLIMLLSASSYAALYDKAAGYKVVDGVVQLGDALYYFKHQLAYAVGGVVVMWLVSRVVTNGGGFGRCPSWLWPWFCCSWC